jgi:hypothetical protein
MLKPVKLPSQAIIEAEELQNYAKKLLSDPKNIEFNDEIFPIFANNSMVFSLAILEFVDNWKNSKNKSKRREELISKMKLIRKRNWLAEDVRGYNLT